MTATPRIRSLARFFLVCAAIVITTGQAQMQVPRPTAPAPPGRHAEEGRPFIRTYAPLDVNAAGQNWSIVQDARGVIYVGSQNGVIEFDGVNWRLIETKNLSTVRSLAIDAAGVIYVGAALDFGYLAPDDTGALQYVSLGDRVPEEARGFNDVWRTFVTAPGISSRPSAPSSAGPTTPSP